MIKTQSKITGSLISQNALTCITWAHLLVAANLLLCHGKNKEKTNW